MSIENLRSIQIAIGAWGGLLAFVLAFFSFFDGDISRASFWALIDIASLLSIISARLLAE